MRHQHHEMLPAASDRDIRAINASIGRIESRDVARLPFYTPMVIGATFPPIIVGFFNLMVGSDPFLSGVLDAGVPAQAALLLFSSYALAILAFLPLTSISRVMAGFLVLHGKDLYKSQETAIYRTITAGCFAGSSLALFGLLGVSIIVTGIALILLQSNKVAAGE